MRCLWPRWSALSVTREIPHSAKARTNASLRFASVGEVPQEPPREMVREVRLVDEFLRQAHYFCHVGGGELVRDGHPVGRTQEVQLHPVDAERTTPNPPRSRQTGGLGDLAGMQRGQQRGVDQEGFRIAYQLADDLPPEGLQKAPELPHPAVQRGRVRSPTTPGNRWEKNRWASRKKERSDSTPRSCCRRARVMTSESASRFMDS